MLLGVIARLFTCLVQHYAKQKHLMPNLWVNKTLGTLVFWQVFMKGSWNGGFTSSAYKDDNSSYMMQGSAWKVAKNGVFVVKFFRKLVNLQGFLLRFLWRRCGGLKASFKVSSMFWGQCERRSYNKSTDKMRFISGYRCCQCKLWDESTNHTIIYCGS